MQTKKESLLSDNSAQANIILIMILVPVALVLFLVMLQMSQPVLDLLWPTIDNLSGSGYIAIAGTLKLFIALIPTIIILLMIYSFVTEVTGK